MTTTSFSYRAHRPTVVARLQERLAQMKVEVLAPEVRSRLAVSYTHLTLPTIYSV